MAAQTIYLNRATESSTEINIKRKFIHEIVVLAYEKVLWVF